MADSIRKTCLSCFVLHAPLDCPKRLVATPRAILKFGGDSDEVVVDVERGVQFNVEAEVVEVMPQFDTASSAYLDVVRRMQELPEVKDEIERRTLNELVLASSFLENVPKNPLFQEALATRVNRVSRPVKMQDSKKPRRWTLGFGPTAIEPGKTEIVQVQPKVRFRGEKIICTGHVDDLTLEGFFVGQKPQLPELWVKEGASTIGNSGASLQHFFTECARLAAEGKSLMDDCDGALHITISVRNRSDERDRYRGQPFYTPPVARVFSMAVVGTAVMCSE